MTTKELMNCENDLTHKHGGCGFVAIEDVGKDYVRVIAHSPHGLGNQAFLAWNKMLSETLRKPLNQPEALEQLVPVQCMDKVSKLRSDIANGTCKIQNTRIVLT